MTRFFTLLIIIFALLEVQGQRVRVVEADTKLPIERVVVFDANKTQFIYTDKNGTADISKFAANSLLSFKHISFVEKQILKEEISAQNFTVYLEDASEQIQEVVLSASRSKEKRTRIAEHVIVITQHKIAEQSPQTSADLLALTPGVKVQKSQFGGGSPVLRGMESNRILLVVDGVRMNNAIYRKGHLQNAITVSPNLLARTEVLFGPSSIVYGSDALGGVIHYYTKKPIISEEKLFNSSLFTRYSSVNDEISASYTGEYSTKKWASLTGVSVSKFGDLTMGDNRSHGFDDWGLVPYYSRNTADFYQEDPAVNSNVNLQRNTGYSQLDLLQKFIVPLSINTELSVNLQYSNSTDIPRFDKLNEYTEGSLKYAEWYYGPQERLLISSQLAINPEVKWMKDGQFTLAYQDISESRNERKFGSLEKYFRDENVKVVSLNGDFHVPLTSDEKRILSYGFETAYNKVNSDAIGRTLAVSGSSITGFEDSFSIQSRYPDGGSSYTNFALYTNYRFDHNAKGTLNIGARYTNTLLKATWVDDSFVTLPDMDISLRNSAVSGTIGYAYKPSKSWQLNSVISSGFRSPNIDDVGKIREKKGNVSVPNTDLKPEYAYNAEIGILKYFNERKSMIGFNTYYTLLHNYIYRDTYTYNGEDGLIYDGEWAETYANVNKGNAYIVGGTMSFKSQVNEHIKLNSSITYTKGESYDLKEALSSIPPIFGNVQMNYKIQKLDLGIGFRFNTRKKADEYNLTEGIDNIEETPIIDANATEDVDRYFGTPSWQTLNFSSQYKLNQKVTLRLKLSNIFDEHYKEFASGVSAPGRNLSLSVNAHF